MIDLSLGVQGIFTNYINKMQRLWCNSLLCKLIPDVEVTRTAHKIIVPVDKLDKLDAEDISPGNFIIQSIPHSKLTSHIKMINTVEY